MFVPITAAPDIFAADTLIFASVGKFTSPSALGRALADVLALNNPVRAGWIRAVAAVEALAAATLLASSVLAVPIGYMLLAACGAIFVAFGVLGRLRATTAPCGCFGAQGREPLGLSNIAIGSAFLVVSLLGTFRFLTPATAGSAATDLPTILLMAAAGLVALTLLSNRALIRRLSVRLGDAPK